MSVLMQSKSNEQLESLGGPKGLAESLRTSTTAGVESQDDANVTLDQRSQAYGANKFKDVPQKAFLALFWENLKDPTLVLLMAAALVGHAMTRMYCSCLLGCHVKQPGVPVTNDANLGLLCTRAEHCCHETHATHAKHRYLAGCKAPLPKVVLVASSGVHNTGGGHRAAA